MTKVLEHFNSLPSDEAEDELLKCCGSKRWTRQVTESRPFANLNELIETADRIWSKLEPQDWLEAFRSHPKIGENNAEQSQSATARSWSEQEQSGTRDAAREIMEALAAGNRDYEKKFGHIFIVCATGKTSSEMLALLRVRADNDAETELRIAAEEQRKITALRLKKLLGPD